MKKLRRCGFKIIATAVLGLGFIGCGGANDTSNDTSNTKTYTGIFADSPVEGLKYSTATLSGTTNDKGEFSYKKDEKVTFKIGNLELGTVAGGELITPLTIMGEDNLNAVSAKATNIARILQTLDEVSDDSDKIKIPSSLQNLDVTNIDFESDADLNTILANSQNITSQTYLLKDGEDALNTMRQYLQNRVNKLKFSQAMLKGETFYIVRPGGMKYFAIKYSDNNLTRKISQSGTFSLSSATEQNYSINSNGKIALSNNIEIGLLSKNNKYYEVGAKIPSANHTYYQRAYFSKIDAETFLTSLPNKKFTMAEIKGKTFYMVRPKGLVYLAIKYNDTTRKISQSGTFSLSATTEQNYAIDSAGKIIVNSGALEIMLLSRHKKYNEISIKIASNNSSYYQRLYFNQSDAQAYLNSIK